MVVKKQLNAKKVANRGAVCYGVPRQLRPEGCIVSDMAQIDRNFAVESTLGKDDIRFYNVEQLPFRVYGVFKENGQYCRMPGKVAEQVSERVNVLYKKTAGGRVRFCTDSTYVAIKAVMHGVVRIPVLSHVGGNGFDLYADGEFIESYMPSIDMKDGYESLIDLKTKQEREILIHFPLYAGVTELYIGLEEGACVKEAPLYEGDAPIVYYGSSITQGGCASRPGMSYQNMLARRLNRDFLCLGFSGNAKAEDAMTDYIKGLTMSAFVLDYDHNAPTLEHLKNTHEKMFRGIRQAQPNLPILILPRPRYTLSKVAQERYAVIRQTYENALAAGDRNVHFIDGPTLMALCGNEGTIDGCHPNDLGFTSMAKAIGDVLEQIL